MAESFVAFLRGANVNGNKISMAALREAFADMGFSGAHTELNTGNVVFSSEQSIAETKPRIEDGLKTALGYDAPVFLRSVPELEALRDAAQALSVPEGCHLYLLICGSAALPAELVALFASLPHGESEFFHPTAGDAFWIVPKGETLTSPFGAKALGSARFQNQLTSRNWNTVEKVLGHMRGN
jgi:uncharacterized protein (DUF1697 family)